MWVYLSTTHCYSPLFFFWMGTLHYGSRFKSLVGKYPHTISQLTSEMGYQDRKSVYELFEKEYFKPAIMQRVLKALGISKDEFLNLNQVDFVNEEIAPHGRKKFIEERIDDLEKIVATLQQQIDQRKN